MAARTHQRLGDESGFTIVEVLVAAIVLLVGLTATLLLIDSAQSAVRTTRAREQATNLQRELVEAARTVSYDALMPDTVGAQVRAQPGLGDSSASAAGWTVRRRGITYTVSMGSCAVDDPQDGTGAREGGVFCANQGTTTSADDCDAVLRGGSAAGLTYPGDCGIDGNNDGTVDNLTATASTTCAGSTCDPAPLDYKRVVSLVRWTDKGRSRWNLQVSTVNSPGLAAAPQITSLAPTNIASGPPWKLSSGDQVGFQAAASPTPVTMSWYLDGNRQGDATLPGGTFTWNLGPATMTGGAQPVTGEKLDGDYLVSVKGFDQYGQFGQPRSVSITVNRRIPFAPINVRAGRNSTAVDIAWSPNKEDDLRGYNVYRRASSGGDQKVCSLVVTTTCRDTSPPLPGTGTLRYYVTAVETATAGSREGDQSALAQVNDTNTPPNPPVSVTARTVAGNPVISWTAPAIGDVDPGDKIDYWVIYRDGTAYDNRYDQTANAQDLSFTDTRANGQTHTYWVAAVDTQLAESVPVGPVTPSP